MRTLSLLLMAALAGASVQSTPNSAQDQPKSPVKSGAKTDKPTPASQPVPAAAPQANALEAVLTQMDRAAANFKSAEADFTWDQFQMVVQETDTQSGKIYFLRHEKDVHMAADIQQPEKKYIVFHDAKIRMYQPRIDQVQEYDASKSKQEVESFLVLGFGGRGHDLLRQFQVRYLGDEVIDGVKTVKLELMPKADRVRNMYNKIVLWVDPVRDVSLKQQAFEPSGDYRTAYYRNIVMNQKIDDDVFKLKTTNKTKVISH
jgi:outer membrane lipoprotein-sorting protein